MGAALLTQQNVITRDLVLPPLGLVDVSEELSDEDAEEQEQEHFTETLLDG